MQGNPRKEHMIDLKQLIESYVHFGHKKTRWNPKMAPYIWGHRRGIHLIDVSKTAQQLEKASKFLEEIAAQGKTILWVGTKPAAQETIVEVGQRLNTPYVSHRWVGGTLTNFSQVKKSVTKFLHYEDVLARSSEFPYTKKELVQLQKNVDRLKRTVSGIRKLTWPVGAVVIIDVKREITALKEAMECDIPVVALIDTNGDPTGIAYPIPGNDDSPRSVRLILNYLAQATQEGKNKAKELTQEQHAQEVAELAAPELLGLEEEETEEERQARTKRAAKGGEEEIKRLPARRPKKPVSKRV